MVGEDMRTKILTLVRIPGSGKDKTLPSHQLDLARISDVVAALRVSRAPALSIFATAASPAPSAFATKRGPGKKGNTTEEKKKKMIPDRFRQQQQHRHLQQQQQQQQLQLQLRQQLQQQRGLDIVAFDSLTSERYRFRVTPSRQDDTDPR